MRDASLLGLISDTHGLLRQEALAALKGCDLIIHAGDVGSVAITDELRTVAPVVVVRGNIDKGEWASRWPMTAVVEAHSTRIYVLHNIDELDLDPVTAQFSLVVSGHSHKPFQFERSGVVYVNPGSAGPRRFRLPTTVALLNLLKFPWSAEFIHLL